MKADLYIKLHGQKEIIEKVKDIQSKIAQLKKDLKELSESSINIKVYSKRDNKCGSKRKNLN